jgi:hypothetical protein
VTFTITSIGTLSIAVPTTPVGLGSEASPAAAGTTLDSTTTGTGFGPVTVLDNRALDPADWTATVACSDFLNATTTLPADTIPATDATYVANTVGPAGAGLGTGTITDASSVTPLPLTTAAQTIVSETGDVGSNGATWSPVIAVHIPANAVVGVYDATVTHSVS